MNTSLNSRQTYISDEGIDSQLATVVPEKYHMPDFMDRYISLCRAMPCPESDTCNNCIGKFEWTTYSRPKSMDKTDLKIFIKKAIFLEKIS